MQHYGIDQFSDLNHLLGANWHVRGLNSQGDYGYANKNTVQFYINKYRPLTDYVPSNDSTSVDDVIVATKCILDTGYYLHFSFTQGYGNATTFGKDSDIFC